jgi:hypothetical protein
MLTKVTIVNTYNIQNNKYVIVSVIVLLSSKPTPIAIKIPNTAIIITYKIKH